MFFFFCCCLKVRDSLGKYLYRKREQAEEEVTIVCRLPSPSPPGKIVLGKTSVFHVGPTNVFPVSRWNPKICCCCCCCPTFWEVFVKALSSFPKERCVTAHFWGQVFLFCRNKCCCCCLSWGVEVEKSPPWLRFYFCLVYKVGYTELMSQFSVPGAFFGIEMKWLG